MSSDPNDFLMGGGGKSAKFETPGDTIVGTICAEPEMRQQTDIKTGEPKFWNNGDPQMQLVVRLQTTLRDDSDDDGIRAIYVKGGFKAPTMQKAIADAVRGAGAKGLAVGGTLQVTFTGTGPAAGQGMSPPKYYTASYQPPVAGAEFLTPPPQQPAAQPNPWQQQGPAYGQPPIGQPQYTLPATPQPAQYAQPQAAAPQGYQPPPAPPQAPAAYAPPAPAAGDAPLGRLPDGTPITPEIAALMQQNGLVQQPA